MVKRIGIKDIEDEIVNEVLSFDATSTATMIEEPVIGGAKDLLARAAGPKEFSGRLEAELLSARPFYLALGAVTPSATQSPFTIKVGDTLQIFTLKTENEYGQKISFNTCRVESLRISCEVGEDVTYELSWRARGKASEGPTGTPSIVEPLVYHGGEVKFKGQVVSKVQSCEIEISNELTDILEIGEQEPIAMVEGPLRVSGRFVVNTDAYDIGEKGSLVLKLIGPEVGTVTVILPDIEISEEGFALDPVDPTSFEYPFTAKAKKGKDIMRVIDRTGKKLKEALY